MKYHLFILFFAFSCGYSFAQSTQKESREKSNSREADRGATYAIDQKKAKKKKSKYSISKQLDNKVKEYDKRMEANAKKYAKMAKEMEKPQYSDPTYFGHKKKPKKRPPGKKKFCKQCQLVH